MPSSKRRVLGVGMLAALALAAFPAGAAAAQCEEVPTSKVFAPLGDLNDYFLAPGGDFEGPLAWKASGPVQQRYTHPPLPGAGPTGVVLGSGGSVTSPRLCADELRPTLRLLAWANQGRGALRVEAVHGNGQATVLGRLPGAEFARGNASTDVPFGTALAIEPNGFVHVRLRLVAEGGLWATDAVYVDPYRS
jgi:hypothetical protein